MGFGIAEALLTSVAISAFYYLLRRSTKEFNQVKKRNKAADEILLMIVKEILIERCHTHLKEGKISRYAYTDLIKFHHCYKELNGNSLGDKLIEQIKELPIVFELGGK